MTPDDRPLLLSATSDPAAEPASASADPAPAAPAPEAPASARGSLIGSWPGTDPDEATRTIFGELGGATGIPTIAELPARGPGADLIGRTAALLVDLPVDLQPSGWRLVPRPGRDLMRAQSFLRQDLDVLAEVADGYAGPLKLQVTGPWTLAASLWLHRLERAVVDPGSCRDLISSLAEGVAQHVAEVAKLVPGAQLIVQIDEPSLPGVVAGAIPTASGFGRLRAIAGPTAITGLSDVVEAIHGVGAKATLHCCASGAPIEALARTGIDGLSLDVSLLDERRWEHLAAAVESGIALWVGVLPTTDLPSAHRDSSPTAGLGALIEPTVRRWRQVGLPAAGLTSVVLTPACGLASANPATARWMSTRVAAAASALNEAASL